MIPPSPNIPMREEPIKEIWIWIATNRDGGEEILCGEMILPGVPQKRLMPLMSESENVAKSLKPFADVAQTAAARAGYFTEVNLRKFIPA